jgi:RNA polymerase sigma-70 factor (ECF subfamily)
MNPLATPPRPAAVDDAEARLVEGARQGDPAAFDALARRHMRRAFSVAYRLLGHREDAEDLVQEAFMVALKKLDTFESGRPFAPWFFRILINRGHNLRASRARRQGAPLPEDAPARTAPPDREAADAELRERLGEALARLPERQRLMVELFELEGFSGAEIAEMLDVAPGTVRWTLHQARQTLRDILAPYREEARDG